MARYLIKNLKVSSISKERPYCFRYRLQDATLKNSIKNLGILMPIVVAGTKRPVVVVGYKRFQLARELKLREVMVFQIGRLNPREAFLMNLVSNWRQRFTEMDCVKALTLASKGFRFPEKEILECVMPFLGLSGEKGVLQAYLEADALSPAFKDFCEDGNLPLRCLASFLKFSRSDQNYFVQKVAFKMKLTSSQFLQIGEWLADLMRGSEKCLEPLLKKSRILKELEHPSMDLRTKADRFFEAMRRLRFPGYSAFLDEFALRKSYLTRDAKNIFIEPIAGFEEKGFEFHARVKGPKELEVLLNTLAKKRPVLNSLFDVVL
ncbi:MAG TPA: ParB N-terminal domain-containing protein [Candidatus Omnitrophota bacterium]|nr:ParB N-terminal domain-containing protein [Candidatus Omnitrophota bacterium]